MAGLGAHLRLQGITVAVAIATTTALLEAGQHLPTVGSQGSASIDVAVEEDDAHGLSEVVYAFYEARHGRPAWTRGAGRVAAHELLVRLAAAHEHGLCPMHYGLPWLRDALSAVEERNREQIAALDVELTTAAAAYVVDLVHGFDTLGRQRPPGRTIDVPAVLARLTDPRQTLHVLDALPPRHAGYQRLRDALADYRGIVLRGGWPVLPDDLRLAPGDTADAATLARLAARLRMSGDLTDKTNHVTQEKKQVTEQSRPPRPFYTGVLVDAIREFQSRHGLVVDGIVGPLTLRALNVSAAGRIDQLVINLNRWRRLPDDLGAHHVRVNIPDYQLRVMVEGRARLQMKTIVGRPATPTPAFSDRIRYVEFNPYWNVPDSIARGELVPQARQDPAILASAGFEVVDGWTADASVLDPVEVDWDVERFAYRLRQRPGRGNALGLVKFMFPNRYSVYLHDTPARGLFGRHRRAFSHGCVRLEKPAALATSLLGTDRGWTPEQVEQAVANGERQIVPLQEPVPVHFTYFTAWVEDGKVQFRDDIYGWDRESGGALSCH